MVSTATQCRTSPVRTKTPRPRIEFPSSSSEDSSSDSSDKEYKDHWAVTQREAAKVEDGTWQIRSWPFQLLNLEGGRRVTWEPMPYTQLKEVNKVEKENGRGSHYLKNVLEATFAAHTLIPHNI